MKRKIVIAAVTLLVCCSLALTAQAVIHRAQVRALSGSVALLKSHIEDQIRMGGVAPESITESPAWRDLAPDVGMLLEQDPRFGLRARLYVRLEGVWVPVGAEGPGELDEFVPAD